MPLRWISKPTPASSASLLASPTAEPPIVVLVPPGSVTPGGPTLRSSLSPRNRLTYALAAGSLLAVALRPMPKPPAPRAQATTFNVSNNSAAGPGSLFQAVQDANAKNAVEFQKEVEDQAQNLVTRDPRSFDGHRLLGQHRGVIALVHAFDLPDVNLDPERLNLLDRPAHQLGPELGVVAVAVVAHGGQLLIGGRD